MEAGLVPTAREMPTRTLPTRMRVKESARAMTMEPAQKGTRESCRACTRPHRSIKTTATASPTGTTSIISEVSHAVCRRVTVMSLSGSSSCGIRMAE